MNYVLRSAIALALVVVASSGPATGQVQGRATVTAGDTITIHGQPIRLHGIDAPESAQTCTRTGALWRAGTVRRIVRRVATIA